MYKNLLIFISVVLFSTTMYGQNSIFLDEENDDTLLLKKYKQHDGHWAGIDFGMNVLLNNSLNRQFGGSTQWKNSIINSLYFNVNILDHKFILVENKLGVTVGLGINHSQISFTNNFTIKEEYDSIQKDIVVNYYSGTSGTQQNLNINKLRSTYVQIPVLVEFMPTLKSWVSIGALIGYRLGSSTKQEYELQKSQFITKTKGDFNLLPFKVDATIRGGYKDWGLFATYSLVPIFNTSKTDEIHPFTFGVSFNY